LNSNYGEMRADAPFRRAIETATGCCAIALSRGSIFKRSGHASREENVSKQKA
jgi:hypothetical protein